MATTPNSLISPQTPKALVQQFSTLDSTGVYKTAYTGSANGSKITGIWATNSDSAASHLLTLQLQRSTVNYGGVATTIPLSAGFANGVAPVNLITAANWPGLPTDNDGNPFLFLQSTLDLVVVTYGTTLSAGTVVNVAGVGADF